MPRKKKETVAVEEKPVVGTPLIEVFAEPKVEEEVRPRKHLVFIKKQLPIPALDVIGSQKVGVITYWESTDDITYDYEVGFQIYMDNFVGRDIDVKGGKSVARANTREWFENLPNSLLHNGFFASEVQSFHENE